MFSSVLSCTSLALAFYDAAYGVSFFADLRKNRAQRLNAPPPLRAGPTGLESGGWFRVFPALGPFGKWPSMRCLDACGPMDLGRRTAGGGCPHMVRGGASSLCSISWTVLNEDSRRLGSNKHPP